MTPAPVYVLLVVRAVHSLDWVLARWCHHQAVLARVSALLGHAVDLAELTAPLASVHALRVRLDADERIRRTAK